jgi:hypothetical protein
MPMRFCIFLCFLPALLSAQSTKVQDAALFDFWVGDWNLTWTNANGEIEKGANSVVKILDGKIIQKISALPRVRSKAQASVFTIPQI